MSGTQPEPVAPPRGDVVGRVAFVTGGSSGIGLGITRALVEAGMSVAITYRSKAHLDEAKKVLAFGGERVHALPLDVTDRAAMAHAAEETVRVFGKVHVLIANAGVGIPVPLGSATYDDWDWCMGVNVDGVFNAIRVFLPYIRSHGEGGHVVATASIGGLIVGPQAGVYSTSKFAVVGMMEALRNELEGTNIGVSVVCPGLVNSHIAGSARNRPSDLVETGWAAERTGVPSPPATKPEGVVPPPGMDPFELGRGVLRGMRNGDLYILTHPEFEQGIRDRNEALLASIPWGEPAPPEARLAAERALLRRPMYGRERDRKLEERKRRPSRREAGSVSALELVAKSWVTQALFVAAKLGIADVLHERAMTCEELATRLGTHPRATHRLLRMLASVDVFTEQDDGAFANNAASNAIREGAEGSERDVLLAMIELGWKPWGDLLHCVKTGEPAFERAYQRTRYEVLDESPELSHAFDRTMSKAAKTTGEMLAAAYDFSPFRRIVDVGGGDGTLLAEVLRAAPRASGVLFERPRVLAGARKRLADAGVADRCECVGGDFLADALPRGDLFLLKSVLHNWDDDAARTIVSRCRDAMTETSKLLVLESLIARGNEPDFHKLVDIHMMVMHGGLERTREEYDRLLASARLRIVSVRTMPATAILEVERHA